MPPRAGCRVSSSPSDSEIARDHACEARVSVNERHEIVQGLVLRCQRKAERATLEPFIVQREAFDEILT
jgi:hypothetical protein